MNHVLINKIIVIVFLPKLLQANINVKNDTNKERSLLTFASRSVFQVTIGVSLEADIKNNVAGVTMGFQHNAALPSNSSLFLSPQLLSAKKFSVYHYLKEAFDRYGYNGFVCLQKMICQISQTPLSGGILEEIINFTLSPSQHKNIESRKSENLDEETNEVLIEQLLKSEKIGKEKNNCSLLYPECSKTPLDKITYLEYL